MSELRVTETQISATALVGLMDRIDSGWPAGTVVSPSALQALLADDGQSLAEQVRGKADMLRGQPGLSLVLQAAAPELASDLRRLSVRTAGAPSTVPEKEAAEVIAATIRSASLAATAHLTGAQTTAFQEELTAMGAEVVVRRTPSSAGLVADFANGQMIVGVGLNGTTIDSADCTDEACTDRTDELRRRLAARGIDLVATRVTRHMDAAGGQFAKQVRHRARRHGDLALAAAEQTAHPDATGVVKEPSGCVVDESVRGRS